VACITCLRGSRERSRFPAQVSDHCIDERLNGGKGMGIFRMYTGADGKSVIEELSQGDPILETLKTCTGCSLQVNAPSEFSDFHPARSEEHTSELQSPDHLV